MYFTGSKLAEWAEADEGLIRSIKTKSVKKGRSKYIVPLDIMVSLDQVVRFIFNRITSPQFCCKMADDLKIKMEEYKDVLVYRKEFNKKYGGNIDYVGETDYDLRSIQTTINQTLDNLDMVVRDELSENAKLNKDNIIKALKIAQWVLDSIREKCAIVKYTNTDF